MRFLPVLLFVSACSYKIEGPTPVVTGARNERDQSTGPAYLCNAQGDAASGWLVDALGDKFAPLPTGALVHTPGVTMPTVALSGPESYTVPVAYVRYIDQTRMPLAMRTADSAADAHALAPGDYGLTVTNLNGASGSSTAAIRVVPPPQITAVSLTGNSGTGTVLCADQAQTLTITGTGFRSDKLPSVAIGAHTFTAATSTATTATVSLPAGTFTSGQTSGAGTVYTVYLTNPEGCAAPYGTAPQAPAQITAYPTCNSLGTLTLNPRFGWTQRNQVVTISNAFTAPATKGFSGGSPTVTISATLKGSSAPTTIPLRRVAFVNANTITAVVPTCSGASSTPFSDTSSLGCPNGIKPGGPYTISISDPAGNTGSLSGAQGFVVVANEPPTIASISPSLGDTSAAVPDLQINSGGLTGTNFAATSKAQIVFLAGANIRACDLPAAISQTTSVIHVPVPTSIAQANCVEYDPTGAQVPATAGFTISTGLFVIRVQDTADPAYGDYSGLIITQPSKKPSSSAPAGAALATARADFPLVQAGDDLGNQYLYALGGIDGPALTGTALSSIEVAQITEFGVLASFSVLDRTALGYLGASGTTPAPRHGLASVAVQVPADTGYLFVLGGIDPSGHALANVERAQVLKSADAPVINSPIGIATGGTLAPGSYYYKVSALLSASDPSNPGGETLASDLEPVTIGSTTSAKATLTWPCLAGAVKYRIFRTVAANQPAGTERLLTEVTKQVASCTGSPLPVESFTDDGGTTPAGQQPQSPGALGRWVAMTPLPTPRGQLAAKRAGDRIFAVGGCIVTTGTPACNGPGFETATVDIASVAGATITGYTAATMTQARRQASLTVANAATAPTSFTATTPTPGNVKDQWLMVLYGQAAGTVLQNSGHGVEVAKVVTNGSATAPVFGDAGYGSSSLGVTGGWGEAVADLLLVFGLDSGGGFRFKLPSGSSTICAGAQCTSNTSFTGTLTDASNLGVTNRFLPGEVLYRAYVYVAGGLTGSGPTDTAQSTVDRIQY